MWEVYEEERPSLQALPPRAFDGYRMHSLRADGAGVWVGDGGWGLRPGVVVRLGDSRPGIDLLSRANEEEVPEEIDTPAHLQLRDPPLADCARYDRFRRQEHIRGAR